ncbi:Afadin- and alpha-actinin-binding protein B [Nymphon striatum]|nr:Afadin- and alpha-actinin-binding protein B [Nymphon striatum]
MTCQNYREISLLNVAYKLLSKLITYKLEEPYVDEMVGDYQSGFLKVATNAVETWVPTNVDKDILSRWDRKMYGAIQDEGFCGVRTRKELYELYNQPDIVTEFSRARLRWLGHLNRMHEKRSPRLVWEGKPAGKRAVRRLKKDSAEEDLKLLGCAVNGNFGNAVDAEFVTCCHIRHSLRPSPSLSDNISEKLDQNTHPLKSSNLLLHLPLSDGEYILQVSWLGEEYVLNLQRQAYMEFSAKYLSKTFCDIESMERKDSDYEINSTNNSSGFFSHDFSSEIYEEFCNSENFHECVSYLSEELKNMGFLPLLDENTSCINLVQIINSLHHLLQLNKRNVCVRSEFDEKIIMANSDINHLQSIKKQLKNKIESFEKTIASMQEKDQQLSEKSKATAAKLKLEKEENRKLQAVIQQRDTQFNHELRKKEREFEKLKDKLNRQLIGKSSLRARGIELSEPLIRANGQREKWKTPENNAKDAEAFHKNVITQFQARIQMLVDENIALRDALFNVQNMINENLEYQSKSESDISLDNSASELESIPSVRKEIFNLPCDLIYPKIKKFMKIKLQKLRSLAVSNDKSDSELITNKYLDENEDEFETKNELPHDHENLNEEYIKPMIVLDLIHQDNFSQLHVNLDEEMQLQNRKRTFEAQMEKLEKEREIYANAAIKLSRERIAFNEEKAEFHRQTFLEMGVPELLPKDVIRCRNSKISSFGDSNDFPTTPELLRALKMSPRKFNRYSLYSKDSPFTIDQCLSYSCHDLRPIYENINDANSDGLHRSLSHDFIPYQIL